jgi:hypothetical protein
MLMRIFIILAICCFVIFVAYWIITGGLSRAIAIGKNLDNPFSIFTSTSSVGSSLKLPWQPDGTAYGVDTYTDSGEYANNEPSTYVDANEATNELQQKYEDLVAQVKDVKTFGNPSPHRGKIVFQFRESGTAPEQEYIQIAANYGNTAPISISGWSVQSAVTGIRMNLPAAASPLVAGTLNSVSAVSLEPGTSATIVSGPSPVGVSFRENRCTGFLAELQTFAPDLDRNCPNPLDELPLLAENIQIYGESCFDYLRSMRPCHFPGNDSSSEITASCRDFAINRLSYNGCIYAHRTDSGFTLPSWRLYLGSGVKLWRPSHDILRLLDEQGRTVDVLTY